MLFRVTKLKPLLIEVKKLNQINKTKTNYSVRVLQKVKENLKIFFYYYSDKKMKGKEASLILFLFKADNPVLNKPHRHISKVIRKLIRYETYIY